jgi:hypothetical protein
VHIRDAADSDWPEMWGFIQPVIAAGDTHCWPTDSSQEAVRARWMYKPGGRVLVAIDGETLVGTAESIRTNPPLEPTSPTQGSSSPELLRAEASAVPSPIG